MRLPKIHELKVALKFYPAIDNQSKNFELRNNDRDYKQNDFLILKPFDSEKSEFIEGDIQIAKITFVLSNCPEYGLMEGYSILGLKFFKDFSYEEKLLFRLLQYEGIKPNPFS